MFQQIHDNFDEPFAGTPALLVGNLGQKGPCMGTLPTVDLLNHIKKVESVRQKKLKNIQTAINKRLLQSVATPEIAFGGIKGRDHLANARIHVRQRVVVNSDISSFFDSVEYKLHLEADSAAKASNANAQNAGLTAGA